MTGSPDDWYRRIELTREEVRVLQRAIRYGGDYPESDKKHLLATSSFD